MYVGLVSVVRTEINVDRNVKTTATTTVIFADENNAVFPLVLFLVYRSSVFFGLGIFACIPARLTTEIYVGV